MKPHQSGVGDSIKRAATADRRSSLYLWMVRNYDEFGATLADAGKPNWAALADAFKDEGLTDLKGRPPTPEGARLTWFKVRQAKNKQAKTAPTKAGVIGPGNSKRPTAVPPTPAPALRVQRTDPPSADDDEGYDFDKTVKRET
jgi:hypothetical protein